MSTKRIWLPEAASTPQKESHLSISAVEEVSAHRKDMLRSIESDILPALRDALVAKLEYERTFLLGIVESDSKASATRKQLNKVLRSEYFVQKPLSADIF